MGVYAALGEEIETGFRPGPDSFGKGSATTFEIIREGGETSPPVGLAKAREMVMQDKVNTMAGIVSLGVPGTICDVVDRAEVP